MLNIFPQSATWAIVKIILIICLIGLVLGLLPEILNLFLKIISKIIIFPFQYFRKRKKIEGGEQKTKTKTPDILKMSWQEFEEFTAKMFDSMGYKTENIQPTRDGGVDVIARKEDKKCLIQCKRYDKGRKIREKEIRDFFGTMIDKKADRGLFITTSSFTPDAEAFAERNKIQLMDGKKLKYQIELLGIEQREENQPNR